MNYEREIVYCKVRRCALNNTLTGLPCLVLVLWFFYLVRDFGDAQIAKALVIATVGVICGWLAALWGVCLTLKPHRGETPAARKRYADAMRAFKDEEQAQI